MSYDSQTCTTVRVKAHPEHGLGFNIRGGSDYPHIPGDSGIFVTRLRDTGVAIESTELKALSSLEELFQQKFNFP